ncbi:Nif3-like dinuclear metal center hexameric protein [Phytomonospora endophytica]|uniref:GTP cyclohydrolase 1 type 2 homolog n=1 Tax=Phytomonospora endophytica TaxID=714109 RepID=A0A841FEX4_9ACTN|nr:dinuclear metal center YbgI/SA1388 family protein [Phytomonospora endophytica]GIG71389.1 GTP cyclohydrolase 1 type 2 [Phytomonospora endophytica]
MTTPVNGIVVAEITAALDALYPQETAESWDRVGLVLGRPERPVRRALLVVDCVPATIAEAVAADAQMIIAHHPLLLRGVSSVAPTDYKGRAVHDLIEAGIALYVAHTNADVADPGVSDALARRLELENLRPLHPTAPGASTGIGRVGNLRGVMTLAEFTAYAADRLPETVWGVRAAGDPNRTVITVAVSGGAGDSYLADATAAGADVYLTADLRHHPASEHLAGDGPALVDAAHWATERPWLDLVAAALGADLGLDTIVSDVVTDPWTLHAARTGLER